VPFAEILWRVTTFLTSLFGEMFTLFLYQHFIRPDKENIYQFVHLLIVFTKTNIGKTILLPTWHKIPVAFLFFGQFTQHNNEYPRRL